MGDMDKGLFVVSGKLSPGIAMADAEKAIEEELEKMKTTLVDANELQKCKNKVESSLTFSETDIMTKATNLAISELLGSADLINKEIDHYNKITVEDIQRVAKQVLRKENCSTLYYMAKKK